MKKENILIKVILLLLCIQVSTIGVVISISATGDVYEIKLNSGVEKSNAIIASPYVDVNSPIRVSFDNTDVLSYTVETEGLIATETAPNSMEYDIVVTEEFGVLDLFATYEDGAIVQNSIYTYQADNKVYISDISKDQAWYNWIDELIDLGELAIDEAQELYYELCAEYPQEYIPNTEELLSTTYLSGKTTIQGRLFWQESVTEIAPLIRAKVQLIKKTNGLTQIIDSQYSNSDGSFKFEIDNSNWNDSGENIFIRWWLEAETYKVTNNWIFNHYCFQGSLKENVEEGSVESLYYVIPLDTSSNHYKATYVHQAMSIAERFAIDMGMSVPNYEKILEIRTKLNVAYPAIFEDPSNAYCFGNDIQSVACIGRNEWQNIDLITHEYGHYVQYLMDIYGSNLLEMICNGPEHSALDNHFSDKWEKEYAMELTWSEAWASVFSTLAEHYFWYRTDQEYKYFDRNAMSDPSCDHYNMEEHLNTIVSYHSSTSNLETFNNMGEAQEFAVESILWDLYDDYSTTEIFDKVDLGYDLWWYYTTESGIYTLEDFAQHMYSSRPDLMDEIGKIMSFYKVAPEIKNISDCNKDTAPSITFEINGCEDNPNNRFEVILYDESGNLLSKTDLIEIDATSRVEYTVSNLGDAWEDAIDGLNYSCDKTYIIYVAVAGYRYDLTVISDSDRSLSGPYISPYIEIILPVEHSFEYQQVDSTTHKLICEGCGGEETILNHTFEYVNLTSTTHTKACADCGYSVTSSHNFVYKSVNDDYHVLTCTVCGKTSGSMSSHSWTTVSSGGLLTGESVKCQFCGHIKLIAPGELIPVIKNKKDPEEETE